MSDDLVKRLREGVEYERYGDMEPDIFSANQTMGGAADLIQSQAARIERLEALLTRALTESTDGPSDLWVPEAYAALKEGQS